MSVDAVVSALAAVAKQSAAAKAHPELAGHFAHVLDLGDVRVAIGTDGVGTKLLLANEPRHFRGIAIDCAAMNANDLLCVGARPVALVDYLACATADGLAPYAEAIAEGFVEAERQGAGGVVGGEVAVLPDVIAERDDGVPGLDLAATAVGVVEGPLLDGSAVAPGDVVVALASSGVHSNGFTRLRAEFAAAGLDYDAVAPWGGDVSLREQVLTPTVLYPHVFRDLRDAGLYDALHAAANITGGGVTNIARVLPGAAVRLDAWPELPPLFAWLAARMPDHEAFEAFNMGVGMVLIVAADAADAVVDTLAADWGAVVIGTATDGSPAGTVETRTPAGTWLTADRKTVREL